MNQQLLLCQILRSSQALVMACFLLLVVVRDTPYSASLQWLVQALGFKRYVVGTNVRMK